MENCGTTKTGISRQTRWTHHACEVQVYACLDDCHGVRGKKPLRRHQLLVQAPRTHTQVSVLPTRAMVHLLVRRAGAMY